MAIQVIWTPRRIDEFINRAELEGIEKEIIKMRHHRYGRIKDCCILADKGYAISPDCYDKIIRKLKHVYDLVQVDSEVLPPRASTMDEAYRLSSEYQQKNSRKPYK